MSRALAPVRSLTLLGTGLMVAGLVAWHGVRPQGADLVLLAIQTLPLLVFVPAMWRNRPKAYIGLCFVLLLYFIRAVEGVFMPSPAWIDYWLLCGSVTLFISAMMVARWLQRSGPPTPVA